jgi:hypothetical protein
MIAHIYGINRTGQVVRISVYQKGKDVRLSGPHGSHPVHQSNISNMDGWTREAALVWSLTDIIDIPISLINSPDMKEKLDELRNTAKRLQEESGEAP